MLKTFFRGIVWLLIYFLLMLLALVVVLELLPASLFFKDYELSATSSLPRSEYYAADWHEHTMHMNSFVTQDGYTMAYMDKGSLTGDVVLLVHGTPTSSWMYRKLIPGLIAAGYRVVVPDMIGYGASDKPYDREVYTLQKQTTRLIALMDYLNIERWHHGFHDMAGIRSRMIARDYPETIQSLIVFNTIAEQEGFYPPMNVQGDAMVREIATGRHGSTIAKFATISSFVLASINFTNTAIDSLPGYMYPFMMGANNAYYQFITSFEETYTALDQTEGALVALDVPVFVAWGMKDRILDGTTQIGLLGKQLGPDDMFVLPFVDAGHLVTEDYPEQIVQNLSMFLSSIP